MKSQNKTFPYKTGAYIFLFLIIIAVAMIGYCLKNAEFPEKYVREQKSAAENPAEVSSGGTLHSGDLWNYYYGKTEAEVQAIAPMFVDFGDGTYRLDRGFLNEEEKVSLTDLFGLFENGRLIGLAMKGQMGADLCGYRSGSYSVNSDDLETIIMGSLAYMLLMGLDPETDTQKYDQSKYSDDYSTLFLMAKNGVRCGVETCPGSDLSVVCLRD